MTVDEGHFPSRAEGTGRPPRYAAQVVVRTGGTSRGQKLPPGHFPAPTLPSQTRARLPDASRLIIDRVTFCARSANARAFAPPANRPGIGGTLTVQYLPR